MYKNGNTAVTNTSSLDVGTYAITCTATGKTNLSTSASKSIEVRKTQTGLEVITNNDVGVNGTIRTDNRGNKRYAGSNSNNWVCFGTQNETCDNNHLYRIIGIIDGKIKIIKNSFYSTNMKWDTSNSNNWNRPSTLKTELNGMSFYGNINYIDEISKNYIANAIWYTGGQSNLDYTLATLSNFVNNERSSSSIGYIGLMSVTDYGYASNNAGCQGNINLTSLNNACISNNYLLMVLVNGQLHLLLVMVASCGV